MEHDGDGEWSDEANLVEEEPALAFTAVADDGQTGLARQRFVPSVAPVTSIKLHSLVVGGTTKTESRIDFYLFTGGNS